MDDLQDALENADAGGLLLLVDELGKFLEHEARHGEVPGSSSSNSSRNVRSADVRPTSSSSYSSTKASTCTHGASAKSSGTTGRKSRGASRRCPSSSHAEQILRIVAAAFSNTLTASAVRPPVRRKAERFAKALAAANALPPALDPDAARTIFAQCYPIHPVTLLLLPDLCQRFAQNERTLFSYLGSREPHGFRDALASLRRAGDWLHPATVYDYFVRNQPAVLSDPLTHRRWAEVVTAVERAGHDRRRGGSLRIRIRAPSSLAKAIGLLNLVSRADGLKASEDVLRLLFPSRPAFQPSVARLHDASVVQYRRFSGEYRVWQGTDFDIDERTTAEAQKLGRFDLAGDPHRACTGGAPVVARRHFDRRQARSATSKSSSQIQSRVALVASEPPGTLPASSSSSPKGAAIEAAFHAMLACSMDRRRRGRCTATEWHVRAALADVLALEGVQRAAHRSWPPTQVAAREIRERLEAARAAETRSRSAGC